MRRSLLVLFMLVVSLPATALAQSGGDVARARALFQRGLDAAHASQWTEARDAFAESLSLAERPSTLLNLAGAQVQTGQLVEGVVSYRRFLEIATGGREAAHRSEAETAIRTVEARIPHVTLHVSGLVPGDEVRLDDRFVMPASLDTAIAVNPGGHDITVSRNDRVLVTRHVDVAEARDVELDLAVPASVAPVVASDTPQPPMDDVVTTPVDDTAHGDDSTTWIIVGVSVGAAVAIGVVIGVVFATQGGSPTPYQGNLGDGIIRF